MRLLLIEPSPHGGLLHYLVQLGDALAARGHSVELLTARDNELVGRARTATMRAELPRLVKSADAAPTGLAYRVRQAGVAARLVHSWSRILVATRTGGHDAVVTGADIGILPAAAAANLLTRIPGRPPIIRIAHNLRTPNRWGGDALLRDSSLLKRLLRATGSRFDLTLVPGERAKAEFEARWASPPPTAIVPHGDERLFTDEPPAPASEERILFFGEWRKVKGLPVLMEAFDALRQRRPGARLTIAGSPFASDTDPDVIRRWAEGHGGDVEVIDRYVPIDDVADIFARARVVATPYLTGNQSGVVALAMTMGRAVVTSDVGELGEAIGDGDGGRVVEPGDAVGLAAALEELISQPELAARYGAANRRRALETTGWEQAALKLERALEPIVAHWPRGRGRPAAG
ncbi:MAG: glycosyltransferase family 4 protein [Solirubrobacteraceae bacterium]